MANLFWFGAIPLLVCLLYSHTPDVAAKETSGIPAIVDKSSLPPIDPHNNIGLKVSFAPVQESFSVGEPIEFACRLENTSTATIYYMMLPPPRGMEVRVDDGPDGAKRFVNTSLSGALGTLEIKPGKIVRRPFFMNSFVRFAKPGNYDLSVVLHFTYLSYTPYVSGEPLNMKGVERRVTIKCGPFDKQKFCVLMQDLVEKTLRGKDEDAQRDAAERLSVVTIPETLPYIRRCLGTTDSWIFEKLLFALDRIGGPEAEKILEELLQKQTDENVRQQIKSFLERMRLGVNLQN